MMGIVQCCKKIRKKLSEQSVVVLWMTAFMLAILFCFSGGYIGYSYVKNNTNNIIESFNYELLNEKVRYIDARIGSIISGIHNIYNIENFDEIAGFGEYLDPYQRFELGKYCKDMEAVEISGVERTRKFVYLCEANKIIANGKRSDCEEYYRIIGGKDYNGWYNDIISSESILNYEKQTETVYFKLPGENDNAVVFVAVPKSELITDADRVTYNDFIICDNMNRQIFSSYDKDHSELLKKLDLTSKNNIAEIDNMVVGCQKPIGYDWSYVMVSDLKTTITALTKARAIMILWAVIGIVLSFIIVYLFARKNRKDIYELYSFFGDIEDNGNKNEYLNIKRSASRLIKQNITNDRIIYNKNQQLMIKLFRDMIVGGESFKNTKAELISCGVAVGRKFVTIAEVYIYDCENLFFEQINDPEKNYPLSKVIIGNVYNDVLQLNANLYVADNGTKDLFLIFLHDDKDVVKQIKETMKIGREIIKENFNIMFGIYLSDPHEIENGFSESYNDIKKVRDHHTAADSWIIDAGDIEAREKKLYSYYLPIETEQQIARAVKRGNASELKENISLVFDANLEKGTPVKLMRLLVMNICNTIVKNASIDNNDIERFYVGFSDFYDKIADLVSEAELYRELTDFVDFVCGFIKQNERDPKYIMIDEIKQFVNENYSDPNLNVNMVAARFGLKTSFLSSLFKRCTNTGLLDYINGVRVEAARKEIENTEKPLSVIWKEVGFSSERTFYRVFEKHTGKTASEFRKK